MPMWDVYGTDRTTGKLSRATVDAPDEIDAATMCGKAMIVNKVKPLDGRPDPNHVAPVAKAPSQKVPNYPDIARGAALLAAIGTIAIGLGILCIVAGALFLVAVPDMRPFGASSIFYGVCAVLYGVLVRFVGALGSAVRDMARNSFK